MRWCLHVKLVQNWQKFSDLLFATEDKQIVEDSWKDDFWGAKRLKNEMLVGTNVLGRLLMELREELQSSNEQQFRQVEPLNIPQFLLYGKEIGIIDTIYKKDRSDCQYELNNVASFKGVF